MAKRYFFLPLLTGLLLLACSPVALLVTPTPYPTHTPYPTYTPYLTPTPTATPTPLPPALVAGWPTFRHDARHTGHTGEAGPGTASVLWTFDTGAEEILSSPAVAGGKVFFGSADGRFYAVDEFSGRELWSYQTGGPVFSSPAVAGGMVYVGSEDAFLYAFDAESGALRWRVRTVGKVKTSPLVAGGRVFFGAGYRDGGQTRFYALDQATGSEVWSRDTSGMTVGSSVSSPVIASDKVVFGNVHNVKHLHAFDALTGQTAWSIEHLVGGGGGILSSPAATGGRIYVGSGDWTPGGNTAAYANSVVAVAEKDGRTLWEYHTGFCVVSSPAVAGGTVFVGSYDTYFYALDADDGHLRWRFQTGDWIFSSPAVAGGRVFFGSNDGYVYALDAESGEEMWRYRTGGAVRSSPAVADGLLFVGSGDGRLHAIGHPRRVASR